MAPRDPVPSDQTPPVDGKALLLSALKALSPQERRELLGDVSDVPTTAGLTPETFQLLAATFASVSQSAVKNTLRMERAENPNYPERSAFHPRGKFDDAGVPLAPKAKLARPTFFNGVRLAGELETEDEINLCNQFTKDMSSRDGLWTATIENRGTSREKLVITVPSKSIDERMNLPPFTMILAELLGGAEAVNPFTMQQQINDLKAQLAAVQAAQVLTLDA